MSLNVNGTLLQKILNFQNENKKLHTIQCNTINQIHAENKKLLQTQYIIMKEIIQMRLEVDKIEKSNGTSSTDGKKIAFSDNLVPLPCPTADDFLKLEEKVKTDELLQEFMRIKVQPLFPSENCQEYLRSIINILMAPECVADLMYNSKDLYGIQNFQIISMIKDYLKTQYSIRKEDIDTQFYTIFQKMRYSCKNKLKEIQKHKKGSIDNTLELIGTQQPEEKTDGNRDEVYKINLPCRSDKDLFEFGKKKLIATQKPKEKTDGNSNRDELYKINLPCKSDKDLFELEKKVKESPIIRDSFRLKLKNIIDEYDACDKCLEDLIPVLMVPQCYKRIKYYGNGKTELGIKDFVMLRIIRELIEKQIVGHSIANFGEIFYKRLKSLKSKVFYL